MDEYGTDYDNDVREALGLLDDRAPHLAEAFERGEVGFYTLDRGRFGVDVRESNAYRVIVDVREGTVEQDGVAL